MITSILRNHIFFAMGRNQAGRSEEGHGPTNGMQPTNSNVGQEEAVAGLPEETTYTHETKHKVARREAPQVTASDHEIEVRTEWGPLLSHRADVRARVDEATLSYGAGSTLFSLDGVFSPVECKRLIHAAEAIVRVKIRTRCV